MFDWLKNKFTKKHSSIQLDQETKPVIITIHGFGRRTQHEFDNLALWGKKDGYDIVQFDMYDLFNEKDCNWMNWVQRAKNQVDQYVKQNRVIYLVGFSMGGVIASYLAATTPIKKLILIAPAFQYFHIESITDTITKSAMSLLNNEKKEEVQLPRSFYAAFSELIKNLKKYISQVQCPVLLLHGDEDEVISTKSSLNAFEKIPHDQKKLFILHQGHHRILMDEKVNWEAYQIMKLFFNDIILNGEKIEMADDILDELNKKKQALDLIKQTHDKKEAK